MLRGNNRSRVKVANNIEEDQKTAFLGSLKYALVREVCSSSISDSYGASTASMLAELTHQIADSAPS